LDGIFYPLAIRQFTRKHFGRNGVSSNGFLLDDVERGQQLRQLRQVGDRLDDGGRRQQRDGSVRAGVDLINPFRP
jgi:hypothetical protein